MSSSVLVVEGESPFGKALVELYRSKEIRTAITQDKDDKKKRDREGPELLRIRWGRGSPVSARNVLLEVNSGFGRLDTAVFPFIPQLKRTLLHETSLRDLESAVDDWMRGVLLLLREILGFFVRQGSGRLALVRQVPPDAAGVHPPLEAMVSGGFQALVRSLIFSYGDSVDIRSFSTDSADSEEFARFVFAILEADELPRRREFRFRGRRGLAGGLSRLLRRERR